MKEIMKLNTTPRHYMPIPQNQSDDEDTAPCKETKRDKLVFHNSFSASESISNKCRPAEIIINQKDLPMSPLRKLMFIISLILCLLFVTIFVYVVPCSNLNCMTRNYLILKWKANLLNMSFTSTLDLINIGEGKKLILIGFKHSKSGLIAFHESNGSEYWKIYLHYTPVSSMCNKIDVNNDGVLDCVIIGENGLLAAIDVQRGVVLWYLHNHKNLDLPNLIYYSIFVSDSDYDDIDDIIVSYHSQNEENITSVALISGGTGQIIGSPIKLHSCFKPVPSSSMWDIKNETYFAFYCDNKTDGSLWLLSLKSFDVIFNSTEVSLLRKTFRIPPYTKDIQFYKPYTSKEHLIIILDHVKVLMLEWSSQSYFGILWNFFAEVGGHIKIVTDGYFINGSCQLIAVLNGSNFSKVIGLDLMQGTEVWSMLQENETIESAIKIPKYFGSIDGLLIKHLQKSTLLENQNDKKLKNNSSIFDISELYHDSCFKDDINYFNEIYTLVKCRKHSIADPIDNGKVLQFSRGKSCRVFTCFTNSTILINSNEEHTTFNLLMVWSTFCSENRVEEIQISYLSLEKYPSEFICDQ